MHTWRPVVRTERACGAASFLAYFDQPWLGQDGEENGAIFECEDERRQQQRTRVGTHNAIFSRGSCLRCCPLPAPSVLPQIKTCEDAYSAADGAHALAILTEW